MFRKMRKEEREIKDLKQKEDILIKAEYGVLSMVDENNYGYGVPISYVYEDGVIYLHCAKEGKKLDDIRKNNKISFTVVGDTFVIPKKFTTSYASIIIFGKAVELRGEEKLKGLISLIKKYSPEFLEGGLKYIETAVENTVVIKIEIEKMSGKANMK